MPYAIKARKTRLRLNSASRGRSTKPPYPYGAHAAYHFTPVCEEGRSASQRAPDSAARRCEGGTAPTLAWPRRTCDRRVRGKRRAKADLERGQRAALLCHPRSSGEVAGAIR